MDPGYNIYEQDEEMKSLLSEEQLAEDRARLDGYLKGRSEAEKEQHDKVVAEFEKLRKEAKHGTTKGS